MSDWNTDCIADDEVWAVVLWGDDTAMTVRSARRSDRERVEMQIGSERDMRDRRRVGAAGRCKPPEGQENEIDEGETGSHKDYVAEHDY